MATSRNIRRPELAAPPQLYYNDEMAKKYSSNTRIITIQRQMSARVIELLNIPPDSPPLFLLDVGSGSCLSGEVLSEAGHVWVGLDISSSMLDIAKERIDGSGDMILRDMGSGVPFRAGIFDGVVSVSALQWLCNADEADHIPQRRLRRFFESLFSSMKRSTKAIFQLYPDNPKQMEMITVAAMRAGFTGGLLVDYPNSTKAKKYFLTLFAGPPPPNYQHPAPLLEGGRREVSFVSERDTTKRRKNKKDRVSIKSKQWILKKKERARKQGNLVRPDTRYTGRTRSTRF